MKKKSVAVASLLMCIVLIFSGCSGFSFNSAENLIRPPKLSGSDGELQDAFEKAVSEKGEYILRYPSAGDYRSAFVRYDCDKDGEDEAFVFYSLKTEEMSVYMYILDYKDSGWTAIDTVPGDGSDIYSIEFCDLNDDGVFEVLVGWNASESKTNKKLSVYCSYENAEGLNYKALAIETYTSMLTVDIDSDGQKEILAALINSTSDNYTTEARLLKMSGEDSSEYQIEAVGQVSLYSEITAFSNIKATESDGKTYIYVDEVAGDTYLTQVLYWDDVNSVLVSPVQVDMLTVSSCPTSRSLPLNCTDIDKDGELEIPSTTLLKNSSIVRKNADAQGQSENIYVTSWNKYNGGDFVCVSSYIENSDDGFRIMYDDVKMQNWSVVFYPESGISQFFVNVESDNDEKTMDMVLLFTLNKVDIDEPVGIESYFITDDNSKYSYEITEYGKETGITKTEIASMFTLI